MKKITLYLSPGCEREALHSQIAEALGFPSYYGANLDALYDCLTDIDEDTCIGIYHAPWDRENYTNRCIDVFLEAEAENRHLCVFVSDRGSERE